MVKQQERTLWQHYLPYIVLFVIILAAILRFYGLAWGYPYDFHGDENFVINMTQQMNQRVAQGGWPNPAVSTYGSLPFYVLWLFWLAGNALLKITGYPLGINTAPMLLVGRLISAFLGTLTVYGVYLLGRRLWNQFVGLWAAFFLAVTVSALRESHFYAVDTMMVCWIVFAMYAAAGMLLYGRRQDYLLTGLLAGLSLATKAAGLPLLVPLFVAHLLRVDAWQLRPWKLRLRRLWTRDFAWMVSLAVGVFLLIDPWPILQAGTYWQHNANYAIATQFDVVRGVYRPFYTMHFAHTVPFLYQLVNPLFWGLGPLLEILGLVGIVYSVYKAWQGEQKDLLILAWVLPYGLIIGSWYAKFVRYVLPLLPFFALLAARWLVVLWQSRIRWQKVASGVLIALTVTTTTFYALAYLNIYRQPDTRLQALAYLRRLPAGSTVLVERDSTLKFNQLNTRYNIKQLHVKVLDHYGQAAQTDPAFFNPTPPPPAQVQAQLYHALTGVDYIVLSDTWMGRYLKLPHLFPAEYAFYAKLQNGQLGFNVIKTFKTYPDCCGITINDDAAELTFHLFDHPHVYIFRREK